MPRKIDPVLLEQQIADPAVSDPYSLEARPLHGFWRIPPEVYEPLDQEFGFTFDPCPNPRPAGFDGRTAEWGAVNWCNPPFWGGLAYWTKKAIEEQAKGRTTVLIAPVDRWIHYLLEAGAEVRPVGNHDWIHTETGDRQKAPRPSALFILHGAQSPVDLDDEPTCYTCEDTGEENPGTVDAGPCPDCPLGEVEGVKRRG